ncbi:putative cytochrome p450 alkane protein [Botrytis cinerea BcDW1]|nr:putative cytochrome p450 alkane protein [Botrytis cinerea BcDW1]
MSNLHTRFGKTIWLNNLGASDIRTIDSENLQNAWSTNNSDWGYQPHRLPVMGPFCGRGFITTDNEEWQKARALLRPTFSKANISDLNPLIASTKGFFQGIPQDGNTTVNLQSPLASLFVGISMKFILGVAPRPGADGRSDEVAAFLKAFQRSFIGMGLSFMLGPLQFLIPKSMKYEAYKEVQSYLDSLIETEISAENQSPSSHFNVSNSRSLLHGLIKETNDRVEIRDNALQGMMAAQDTTPVLLSNTLFLLSRNSKVYDRLRSEVQSLDLEESQHLYDKLRSLSFLRNIINESLRLFPIFPALARISLKDTTLPKGGGKDGNSPIYVPRGTKLWANFYGLHRIESVFGPDVESFDPDRWYSIKPSPWEYMPFGGGPRACVGQNKALVEASYVLAKFAQLYKRIESRDARDWAGQQKLTASNANGCKVVCVPA